MVGADVADAFRREYLAGSHTHFRLRLSMPYRSSVGMRLIPYCATLRHTPSLVIARGKLVNATPRRLADAHALLKGNRPFHSARVVVRRRARRARSRDGVRGSGRSAHSVVRHARRNARFWLALRQRRGVHRSDRRPKDYYFRSNTIEPESANTGSDFSRFREETHRSGWRD